MSLIGPSSARSASLSASGRSTSIRIVAVGGELRAGQQRAAEAGEHHRVGDMGERMQFAHQRRGTDLSSLQQHVVADRCRHSTTSSHVPRASGTMRAISISPPFGLQASPRSASCPPPPGKNGETIDQHRARPRVDDLCGQFIDVGMVLAEQPHDAPHSVVMTGLDPVIHLSSARWIAGSARQSR